MSLFLFKKSGKFEKKRSWGAFFKLTVAALLCTLSVSGYAQTLTADVNKACSKTPIFLRVTGYPDTLRGVDFYASAGGGEYKYVGTAVYGKYDDGGVYGQIITPMDSTGLDMDFGVVENKKDFDPQKCPTVTVKNTTDCPKECHTTSTGDYFNGTDFDPVTNPKPSTSTPAIPNGVENYFEDNDIRWTRIGGASYNVTNNVSSLFGTTPSMDKGGNNNFYYAYTNNIGAEAPFQYEFKCSAYEGKYYRFKMRLYLKKKDNNCGSSAKLKLETGHGNQTDDKALIMMYDDADVSKSPKPLDSMFINKTFGEIDLRLGDSKYNNKLIRMEIEYYGYFPTDGGTDGKYNGLTHYTFKPLFQQFEGCFALAIDYISAEFESVCLTSDAICAGGVDVKTVNAAGFPYGAIFHWEEQMPDGSWKTLKLKGVEYKGPSFTTVAIPANEVGKKYYRVSDANTPGFEPIEFFVSAENCGAVEISEIIGHDVVCIPTAVEETYEVDPVDKDENVHYVWELYNPKGEKVGGLQVDNDVVSNVGVKGEKVKLKLNASHGAGTYRLVAWPSKRVSGTNVEQTYDPVSYYIEAVMTPSLKLELQGYEGDVKEEDKFLCASNDEHYIKAVSTMERVEDDYEYIYEWSSKDNNLTPQGDGSEARIDMVKAEVCDLKTEEQVYEIYLSTKVKLKEIKNHEGKVIVSNFEGCPAGPVKGTYRVKVENMSTTCLPVSDTQIVELGPTQKDTVLTIADLKDGFEISKGCDPNPTVKIEAEGKSYELRYLDWLDIRNGKVSASKYTFRFPIGVRKYKYTIIDGCGITSYCERVINIKDVTPPNINCGDIKGHVTKTSWQPGCEAQPEYDKGSLPELSAPVLKDLNGVDGTITGIYGGRAEASGPSSKPENLNYSTKVDLNDNYKIGITYIKWIFDDKRGNETYCYQKIEVIDDRKPILSCPPAAIGDVANKAGYCGLSVKGLIAQLDKLPSAEDPCSGGNEVLTVDDAEVWYKDVDDKDSVMVPNDKLDEIIFHVNHTYKIIWRFKKKNGQAVDDCVQTFTVKDKEEPIFDCSSLPSVRVTANYYKETGKLEEFLKYATKEDVEEKTPGAGPGAAQTTKKYIGTLGTFFDNKSIREILATEVKDNCEGGITVSITIEGPDDKGKIVRKDVKSFEEVENNKYYTGLTNLIYEFKDASGNVKTCSQSIIVTGGTTPVPIDCPDPELTLEVDGNCEAAFKIVKGDVPTAYIPVNQEAAYFEIKSQLIPDGISGCDVADKFFPDNLNGLKGLNKNHPHYGKMLDFICDKFSGDTKRWDDFCNGDDNKWNCNGNGWGAPFPPVGPGAGGLKEPWSTETFWGDDDNRIVTRSGSLTKTTDTLGYPYEVELIDMKTGKTVSGGKVLNEYDAEESVESKYLIPRVAYEKCLESAIRVCASSDVKLKNNFPAEIMNLKLKAGEYRLVYRFEDVKNGQRKDSCEVKIHVVDKIAPSIECGDWTNKGTFYANENCEVPFNEVPWFKKPSLDDLNATDNCGSRSELTLSWEREHNNLEITSEDAFKNNFKIGTTVVTYIVKDTSGNEATCVQEIIVVDTLGPSVNCDNYKDLEVETGDNCQTPADVVVKAGLVTPVIEDEKCSPTGKDIVATGTRSDGKDIFKDPYPLGETVITWVFEDGIGNKSVCEQSVIVKDNRPPDKAVCDEIKDKVLNLAPGVCVATEEMVEVLLGEHKTEDDCDTVIVGVPYVFNGETSKLDGLYDKFKKDTTYKIVWLFTDKGGNTARCDHNLTIKDTTPPDNSNICPEPKKSVNAETVCELTFGELNLPTLSLEDKCDGTLIADLYGDVLSYQDGKAVYTEYKNSELEGLAYPVGIHYFKWVFTDKGGNESVCEMELEVKDKIKPKDVCKGLPTDTLHITVSDDKCATDAEEVLDKFTIPVVIDECDSMIAGSSWRPIDPIVKRYHEGELERGEDGLPYDFLTWDDNPFKLGVTEIRFIYIDNSKNIDSCSVYVSIEDKTAPVFDCDKISPNPIKPVAKEGSCEVAFNEIKFGEYYAKDNCSEQMFKGELWADMGNVLDVNTLKFAVGDTITLYWMFVDNDGNKRRCPQVIIPMHDAMPDFDCNSLSQHVGVAKEGACYANAADLKLDVPIAKDSCMPDTTFYGIGTREDGKLMTDPFPTGTTVVNWAFVSPYNLKDTLVCTQEVFVKGNNEFDFDCDTLVPTLLDTVADCKESEDAHMKIEIPKVADPCADPASEDYWRIGAGERSDSRPLDAGYPLGVTTITWTFTDFTGNVTKTCNQDFIVKTSMSMNAPCESLLKDTIKRTVPQGECKIGWSTVGNVNKPVTKNPCWGQDIVGDGYVMFGNRLIPIDEMGEQDSLYIGITKIMWIFKDETGILIDPIDTCFQNIQVGDVNQLPVDCDNMPDKVFRLKPEDCEISAEEVVIYAPEVIDLCTNKVIIPDTTRSSGKKMDDVFSVGVDTISWEYSFGNQLIVCNQVITVKDSMAPFFDCDTLDTIRLASLPELCYITGDVVADSLGSPFALEACTKDTIYGVATDTLGNKLPTRYAVGDTFIVKWTFVDTVINEIPKICYQAILVTGDQKPVFNCDDLEVIEKQVVGCKLDAAAVDFPTPVAKDYCTQKDVPGVGYQLTAEGDILPLISDYPLGKTKVMWVFDSPFSSASDTCYQTVHVRTKQPIVFNCDSLKNDTIRVDVENGFCFVPFDSIKIDQLYAINPCTRELIAGVKKRSDGESFSSVYRLGETKIEWTFTDTTGTLVDTFHNCFQVVIVEDINKPMVDCKDYPDTLVLLDENDCFVTAEDLNIESTVKPVFDLCSGAEFVPEHPETGAKGPYRTSGKLMTDNYELGTDTIVYYYNFTMRAPAECRQVVTVKDTIAPNFDCETLDKELRLVTAEGLCDVDYVGIDAMLPKPVATIDCIVDENGDKKEVPGVFELIDVKTGNTLEYNESLKLKVGDTVRVVWTFFNDTFNTKPLNCEQQIVVLGSAAPVFNCDSLGNAPVVDTTTNCKSVTLGSAKIITPIAVDSCTGIPVPGKGVRLDGGDLYGAYPVGNTVIRWYFESPLSVKSDSCDQNVIVKGDWEPNIDCSTLTDITVQSVQCVAVSASEVDVPVPNAKDSCTKELVPGRGVRLDGKELTDEYPVGKTVIRWYFESPYSVKTDSCDQNVIVKGDIEPEFDCAKMSEVPLLTYISGCDTILDADTIKTPYALDACTKDPVPGVGVRADGGDLYGIYNVGYTTITWTFTSPYSSAVVTCDQQVLVQSDSMRLELHCDEDTLGNKILDTIEVAISEGECFVDGKTIDLRPPFAINPCTKDTIVAVGVREDGGVLDGPYFASTEIKWIIKDTSSTLKDGEDTCYQYVKIGDSDEPIVDCDQIAMKDTTVYFAPENCTVDASEINLNVEKVLNPCDKTEMTPTVTRVSGKNLDAVYEIGTDTVVWTYQFKYANEFVTYESDFVCKKAVTVEDTVAPAVKCYPENADTIKVTLYVGKGVAFDSVAKLGLVKPEVLFECSDISKVTTDLSLVLNGKVQTETDTFRFGTTKVTWLVKDSSGNVDSSCVKYVIVEDLVPPVLNCPDNPDKGKVYACLADVPAPLTEKEFFDKGGFIDVPEKVKEGSFSVRDTMLGSPCDSMLVQRYYSVVDLSNRVIECGEGHYFYVYDNVGPVIQLDAVKEVLSCSEDIPVAPDTVWAIDNCGDSILAVMTEENDRVLSPDSCDYYNYDIVRTWMAFDSCGNAATAVTHKYEIRDTLAPRFIKPEGWLDTLRATNIGYQCKFKVPDFVVTVKGNVDDNCVENLDNIIITQEPPVGDTIAESMGVKVYIKDLCGNTEVIDCYVEVQDRKEIVKLEAFDVDSCVSDDAIVDLDAKSVVNYSGHIWRQVFGKWYSYTSRIFVDYYRGDVAAENLIYSNNKFTYGDDLKLDDKEALKLSRRSKSGRYAVVAMDTVAFCKDTAYFDVRLYERPRVSLDTGSIVVCEYDSIPLFQKDDTLSHRYNVCIDDMGAPITEEGWMLDGVVYKSKDSVYYTGAQRDLTYYADNRCGRTTSDDSYFFVCGGAQDYSAIDSFELLGNSRELLDLWRAEKLKSVDSIVVNVRERYKIDELVLTTKPQDKARVWRGEDADLVLKTNYKPLTYYWYRVEGLYDGRYGIEYDELGDVKTKYDNPMDVDDELLAVTHSFETEEPFKYHISQAMDTSMYYVVVTDSVCPALPSNLVRMDVLDQLPTAITPYVKDGMNDEFMPGYSVRIFNRYGQMLFEGEDGWDGTYRGMMADPGVYYYEVTMKNGVVNKGSVEVVKIE